MSGYDYEGRVAELERVLENIIECFDIGPDGTFVEDIEDNLYHVSEDLEDALNHAQDALDNAE